MPCKCLAIWANHAPDLRCSKSGAHNVSFLVYVPCCHGLRYHREQHCTLGPLGGLSWGAVWRLGGQLLGAVCPESSVQCARSARIPPSVWLGVTSCTFGPSKGLWSLTATPRQSLAVNVDAPKESASCQEIAQEFVNHQLLSVHSNHRRIWRLAQLAWLDEACQDACECWHRAQRQVRQCICSQAGRVIEPARESVQPSWPPVSDPPAVTGGRSILPMPPPPHRFHKFLT